LFALFEQYVDWKIFARDYGVIIENKINNSSSFGGFVSLVDNGTEIGALTGKGACLSKIKRELGCLQGDENAD
jgi:hypothetical protein